MNLDAVPYPLLSNHETFKRIPHMDTLSISNTMGDELDLSFQDSPIATDSTTDSIATDSTTDSIARHTGVTLFRRVRHSI